MQAKLRGRSKESVCLHCRFRSASFAVSFGVLLTLRCVCACSSAQRRQRRKQAKTLEAAAPASSENSDVLASSLSQKRAAPTRTTYTDMPVVEMATDRMRRKHARLSKRTLVVSGKKKVDFLALKREVRHCISAMRLSLSQSMCAVQNDT